MKHEDFRRDPTANRGVRKENYAALTISSWSPKEHDDGSLDLFGGNPDLGPRAYAPTAQEQNAARIIGFHKLALALWTEFFPMSSERVLEIKHFNRGEGLVLCRTLAWRLFCGDQGS